MSKHFEGAAIILYSRNFFELTVHIYLHRHFAGVMHLVRRMLELSMTAYFVAYSFSWFSSCRLDSFGVCEEDKYLVFCHASVVAASSRNVAVSTAPFWTVSAAAASFPPMLVEEILCCLASFSSVLYVKYLFLILASSRSASTQPVYSRRSSRRPQDALRGCHHSICCQKW